MSILTKKLFLTVKDYSFSKEEFDLRWDESLGLLSTYPQPDPSKLSRYYDSDDYISHTDLKRSLFEKMYHLVKEIALRNKLGIINKMQTKKGQLLDIGAGTGDFLMAAKKNGWQTIGVEPSQKANAIATQKGLSYIESTAVIESHSVDVITMWHVLEHVPNLQNQICELQRLLKPNGIIFIAVPNFNSYDAKYYKEFWAGYDVPRHLWHFSKTAIKILFEREKLQLIITIPMLFDAFYVSLLSEKYKSGKMNFIKAFLIAIKSNLAGYRSKEFSSHIYVIKHI